MLLLAIALLGGSFIPAAPLAASTGLGLCAWLLRQRLEAVGWLLAIAMVGLGASRATLHVRATQAQHREAQMELRGTSRCAFTGQVISSPSWRGNQPSFDAALADLDCEGRLLPGPYRARLYGGPAQLARGDRFEAIGQLGVRRWFRNRELLDPTLGVGRTAVVVSGGLLALSLTAPGWGVRAEIDAARGFVRERIAATFAAEAEAVARALVLGENDLSDRDAAAFQASGLAHLLAVSGTHLVFAVLSLVGALRALLVRWQAVAQGYDVARVAAAAGVPLALLYADFAGGSGSAWRAAWMLAAGFLLRALDRSPNHASCIGVSILLGWLFDPLVSFDLSFMLSLAATAGLLTLGRSWSRRLPRAQNPLVRFVLATSTATVAATLPCALLISSISQHFSLIGIAANVVAAPFGEVVALPLCLAHSISSWWEGLETGLAAVASGALIVVRRIALFSAAVEQLSINLPRPGAWHYCGCGVAAVGAWLRWSSFGFGDSSPRTQRYWIFWACAIVGAAEVHTWWSGNPRDVLRVTFLDVAQGDAALVDLPDGTKMLVDGGGLVGSPVDLGERVLLPVLRARRVSKLDIVVLSHPHPDHFGGLARVLEEVEVGELWDTGMDKQGSGPRAYRQLLNLARARKVKLRRPAELCGKRTLGGAVLEVYGPCPGPKAERSANDNSFVFSLRYGHHAVLLTGDAESEQEAELVDRFGSGLASDVLKVGHHGSRSSSTNSFLAHAMPKLAVVSCGMRNRFGHPHQQLLQRLEAYGAKVWRTDLGGSLIWVTDGRTWSTIPYEPLLNGVPLSSPRGRAP